MLAPVPTSHYEDANLFGAPLRVMVSHDALREAVVEFKARAEDESWRIPLDEATDEVVRLVAHR